MRVLFAVRRIPAGRVATYGDVAAAAGVPRAARAVGNIMKGCRVAGCPLPPGRGGGRPAGRLRRQRGAQTRPPGAEGLTVSGARVRDFDRKRFIFRK